MTHITPTQADHDVIKEQWWSAWLLDDDIDSAAKMIATVRQEARLAAIEECAKVCDDHARHAFDVAQAEGQSVVCGSGRNHGARFCATAIRNLGSPS